MKLALVLGCLLAVASAWFAPAGIVEPTVTLQKTFGESTVWALGAAGYDDPYLLVDIRGNSRYNQGFAYGHLLANESVYNYDALFYALLGNDTVIIELAEVFLDHQYNEYLSKYLPQEYLDEFHGMTDAGLAVGIPYLGKYATRAFTIASIAVGDIFFDIIGIIIEERNNKTLPLTCKYMEENGLSNQQMVDIFVEASKKMFSMGCSHWGAWGSRTDQGVLFTGRNLDWEADTGISKYKTLTVWHPEGKHASVSLGFAGLTGAITGMSDVGLTVSESGNDNYNESLAGFGWVLRLRHIMENAETLSEARTLWDEHPNTMGINHGIGSAKDINFMELETTHGYTAYFYANDTREAANPYGLPLPEAVWRTNHGYDPQFLSTAEDKTPTSDSQNRYVLLHDAFIDYQNSATKINEAQAVNITALVGDKGGSSRDSFLSCDNAANGINIISAAYHPGSHILFVAFENGHAATHVPACCNNYVRVDMSKWFN